MLSSGGEGVELQGVFFIVSKCHKLWSTNDLKLDLHFHKRLKTGPEFLPTLTSLFCSVPVHRTDSKRHKRGTPEDSK